MTDDLYDSRINATLREIIRATELEIKAARHDPSRFLEVFNGQLVASSGRYWIYRFETGSDPALPPDTPLTVLLEGFEPIDAKVMTVEDFEIWVETREELPEPLTEAKLSTEPWFILKALISRIEDLIETDSRDDSKIESLLGAPSAGVSRPDEDVEEILRAVDAGPLPPNSEQREAVRQCITQGLHFVWGPPGTGKTLCAAQTARAVVESGGQILVLATSNAAVDVATLRIVRALSDTALLDDGRILRAGTPQSAEVREIPQLSPEKVAAARDPELADLLERLEKRERLLRTKLRRASDPSDRDALAHDLDLVRSELKAVRNKLRQLIGEIVRDAAVVTCTLAKLTTDSAIWNLAPDAVLIDEASMAPLAYSIVAASRARRHLLFFGDFQQLSPIVVSDRPEAQHWFGSNAFDSSGVRGMLEQGIDDARVTMLQVQYRMTPAIGELVSDFAYFGRLRHHESVAAATKAATSSAPFADSSLLLVDTSSLRTVCSRDPRSTYSRLNPLHSLIATALAARAADQGQQSVACVSPYRSQARTILRLLRSVSPSSGSRTATVHRFQGSEADVVIVDLVDAYPELRGSNLTGEDRDTALRLANVAISRARGKLIVLCDVAFVDDRHRPDSPIRVLIELLREHGRLVPPEELFRELYDSDFVSFHNWDDTISSLSRQIDDPTLRRAQLNIPDSLPVPGSLTAKIAVAATHHPIKVAASLDVAEALESSAAEVRLRTAPVGFLATVHADSETVFLGSAHADGMFARLGSRAWRALFDEDTSPQQIPLLTPNALMKVDPPSPSPRERGEGRGEGPSAK